MPTPLKLFYSYARKDESLRDELETHLKILKRQGLLASWHDRAISAGTEWAGAIDENLEAADIILLLVSANFIASDYCFDTELKRAMERHEAREARVIPIFITPCDWSDTPFHKLQGLPKDAKPVVNWATHDEAWTDVAKGIRGAIVDMGAQRNAAPNAPATRPAPTKPAGAPASPAPATATRAPTGASLRKLLEKVIRSDSDFNAFCLDYFPRTHRRFANGLDRVDKANLLFQHEDAADILVELRKFDAAAVARHEGLLEYA